MADTLSDKLEITIQPSLEEKAVAEHETLKYSLLGPSLTKSGQDNVDQQKAIPQILQANARADIRRSLR
jgi:DNA polymerase kappa